MKNPKQAFTEMQFQNVEETGRELRGMGLDSQTLLAVVQGAMERSDEAGVVAIRGVLETAPHKHTLEEEAATLINCGLQRGARERQMVCRALRESGGGTGESFVVAELPRLPGAFVVQPAPWILMPAVRIAWG